LTLRIVLGNICLVNFGSGLGKLPVRRQCEHKLPGKDNPMENLFSSFDLLLLIRRRHRGRFLEV